LIEQPIEKQSTSESIFTCDGCGATTVIKESLQPIRKNLRQKYNYYCPDCYQAKTDRSEIVSASIYCLYLPLAILLIWLWPNRAIGYRFFDIFLCWIFYCILVIFHEFGHYFGAWLAKVRVFSVVLGRGPELKKFKPLKTDFIFNKVPGTGCVVCPPDSEIDYKKKQAIVSIAGIFVELILFAITAIYITKAGMIEQIRGKHIYILNDLFIVSVIFLYWQLRNENSDLRKLIRLPKMTVEQVKESVSWYFVRASNFYLQRENYQEALKLTREGTSKYPKNEPLQFMFGYMLAETNDFEEARHVWLSLLSRDIRVSMRAEVLNGVAFADFMTSAELLPEADKFSIQACDLAGWNGLYNHTRALVLIETGKTEQGLQKLNELAEKTDLSENKAMIMLGRALAECRRGNRDQAQKFLEEANKLDSESSPLKTKIESLCAAGSSD
jgi:tetratricopeptide (TPR) repeat protein